VKSFRDGGGPNPTGEKAAERRRDLVRRLLADAAVAAETGDLTRFAHRTDELVRLLPRVPESFANQVRWRLGALNARLARHQTSPQDRAVAITKMRWFVMDTDELIHRQDPDSPTGAMCGHTWLAPIWQGKIGRNDFTWCQACERELVSVKQARRAMAGASEPMKSVRCRKAIAEQRRRNEAGRLALALDQPALRAERGSSVWAVLASSPGSGKRR
jgi:hypothetical protein